MRSSEPFTLAVVLLIGPRRTGEKGKVALPNSWPGSSCWRYVIFWFFPEHVKVPNKHINIFLWMIIPRNDPSGVKFAQDFAPCFPLRFPVKTAVKTTTPWPWRNCPWRHTPRCLWDWPDRSLGVNVSGLDDFVWMFLCQCFRF